MFKILNKYISLLWLVFVTLLSVSIYVVVAKSCVLDNYSHYYLFPSFFKILNESYFIRIVVVILNLVLQLLLISSFLSQSRFITPNSPYPSIFYLALLLSTNSLITITPIFFTNTILLIILCLNVNYDNESRTKRNIFFTGILVALGCCFDFAFIVTLLFVIISLMINLYSKIRHIMILLSGFIILITYIFSYYLFTDSLSLLQNYFSQISPLYTFNSISTDSSLRITFFAIAFFASWIMIFKISQAFESKIVAMRKRHITLQILYVVLFLSFLFCTLSYPFYLQYLVVPLACFFVAVAQLPSRLFINELLVLFIFLGLCL